MQILKVIIWQKNGEIRKFPFEKNKVNVITGDAGKGKTTLIHIIDFCLLSSDATRISKKVIDEDVNWYGLLFNLNGKNISIARPAFHKNSLTRVYYSDVGEVPLEPELKIEVSLLKLILQKEFAINDSMQVPYGGRTIKAGSQITFRNFLYYSYQDQTTLTSSDYLYMNYNIDKVKERIDRTFGMALGVDNEKTSIIRKRLVKLENEKDTLERKIKKYQSKMSKFNDEIYDLYKEALNLNIVTKKFVNHESALKELKNVEKNLNKIKFDKEKFEQIDKEIFKKNQQIKKIDNFNDGYKSYLVALKDVEDSLKPSEYLLENATDRLIKSENLFALLNSLDESLQEVRFSISQKKSAKLVLINNESKKKIQYEIKELEKEKEKVENIDIASYKDLYLYIGKLNAILEFYSEIEDTEDLNKELKEKETKISELRRELDEDNAYRSLSIELLNEKINKYLQKITINGYEDDKAIFDERSKTVNILRKDNGTIELMSAIGSHSNYLNLHLAYFLSFHEIVREREINWMPSFIIFDQINSPYYNVEANKFKTGSDKQRFDSALSLLNEYVESMQEQGFQIILLEHIEEEYWKNLNLKNFNLVGKELRGDEALILKNK